MTSINQLTALLNTLDDDNLLDSAYQLGKIAGAAEARYEILRETTRIENELDAAFEDVQQNLSDGYEDLADSLDAPISLIPSGDEPTTLGLYEDSHEMLWELHENGWQPAGTTHEGWEDWPAEWSQVAEYAPFELVAALEVDAPDTYSLNDAVAILRSEGIDTGQRRLKKYLNESICWTDGFNNPRESATDYLEVVKQASPERDAVVRVTAAGVAVLVATMKKAV